MLKNATLTVISLLLTLVLLEGATRLYYAIGDRVPPHPDPGVRDEWRWAAEHLAAGQPVIEGLSGFDEMLGWREPGPLAQWLARKSWNPPPDPWRDDGVPRTLFLGDSFTAGLYVEPHQAFAYVYGQQFEPRGRALNLGVSGYGIDQMILLFEATGTQLHADTVVLGFYLGGFDRALSGFTYYAKPRFMADPDAAELHLTGTPVPSPQSLYDLYVHGGKTIGGDSPSLLWSAGAAAWQRWQRDRTLRGETAEGWNLLTAVLSRFTQRVAELGARPVLLVIPTRLDDFEDSNESALEQRVVPFACGIGMTPVVLSTTFRTRQSEAPEVPLFRPREDGGHFSVAGHRLAAEILAAHLADNPIRGCSDAAR